MTEQIIKSIRKVLSISMSKNDDPGARQKTGLFSKFKKPANEITRDEILAMVKKSQSEGSLRATEAEMIRNIFEFSEKDAKDIMTHRNDMITLDGDVTLQEAVTFFSENANHYSRIPVFVRTLDNIIGIIHLKEIYSFLVRGQDMDKKIRDIDGLIRKAQFIPETHGVSTLFTQMQYEKNHMVIVMDEYGQTSGLITMEDILEEIVGNIYDEHDQEKSMIKQESPSTFYMDGMTPLEEAGQKLGIRFKEIDDDIETLNGFLLLRFGEIPRDHQKFKIHAYGHLFEVQDVEEKKVTTVKVSLDTNGKS